MERRGFLGGLVAALGVARVALSPAKAEAGITEQVSGDKQMACDLREFTRLFKSELDRLGVKTRLSGKDLNAGYYSLNQASVSMKSARYLREGAKTLAGYVHRDGIRSFDIPVTPVSCQTATLTSHTLGLSIRAVKQYGIDFEEELRFDVVGN